MRREAKLVVAVLVLVVGPTAVLSLLTARVLKNWQIVIEKQLETDAERALLTVADNLASTFATGQEQATRGVAEALGRENNQARLVSFAAAFCRSNEWADRLLVVRVPEGVIYPPPLSGACVSGVERARDTEGARNDPESPQAMRQKALHLQYQHGDFEGAAHEYAALFERADAPADLRCEAGLRLAQCYRKAGRAPQAAAVLRSVMSGDPERKAEARVPVDAGPLVRDPEEGYLYALTAAQVLTELLQETGAPAAALDNEMTLLARFVAAYSDVVPCQRATLLADIDRRLPALLAAGADRSRGGDAAARVAVLRAELREWETARRMPDAERAALTDSVARRTRNGPPLARAGEWIVTEGARCRLAELRNQPGIFAGYAVSLSGLERQLRRLAHDATAGKGLRIVLKGLGNEPAAASPALAEQRLAAPLELVTLAALPLDPEALRAHARLQSRFYGWGVLLLAVGVAGGAWVVLRQAAAEIRQARLRSGFVASVSHDLRTPLASMRMLAESLYLGRIEDPAKQQAFLGAMLRECDRLSRLTDRALYFIRLGQDALQVRLTEGDIGAVVKDTTDAFAAGMPEGTVQLEVAVADRLPSVRFDLGAMEQVIMNLLDNAVKYSPERKEIRVSAAPARDGREVVITVQDRGIGIDAQERRKIFRAYYRGSDRQVARTTGMGLGLALCRHIVRAHAGRIEVESRPGEGSAFRVVLPATTEEA